MRTSCRLLLVLLTMNVSADIVPVPGSQRVRPVFDASDLVCAGIVSSVDISTQPMPANSPAGWVRQVSRVVIEVKDKYKEQGSTEPRVLVTTEANVPASSSAHSIFRNGDTFLLFLRASNTGQFTLADPFLGANHFAAVPVAQRAGVGLEKLEDALTQIAVHGEEQDAVRALQLLSGFDSVTNDNFVRIREITSSVDAVRALTAFDVLLTSRNAQVLHAFSSYLGAYKGNAQPPALSNIGTKLADFRDKESLPWIEELTQSRYISIRTGAMRSLRARRDPMTAGVLIGRLDDPDLAIQYLAVISLAEIFNKYDGDYAPSMYLFDKRPDFYASLWRQWWAEEGRKLYLAPAAN